MAAGTARGTREDPAALRRYAPPVAAALGSILVAAALGVPAGVVGLGLVLGGLWSLTALGLVLIWRTQRFLHIGHATLGLMAGAFVGMLVTRAGWAWWPAAAAALVVGGLGGLLSESVLVGRLGESPRLGVMVASVGLAYVFGAVTIAIVVSGGVAGFVLPPLEVAIVVGPVRFGGAHVLAAIMVPACLAITAWLLERTRIGLATRALAQNAPRARALGIPVRPVSRLLWGWTGVLAAVAGVLSVPLLGPALRAGPAPAALLLALAPAVLAGLGSLPATVLYGLATGVVFQTVLWRSPTASLSTVALFIVIAAALLLVRPVQDARRGKDASSWSIFAPLRPFVSAGASPARRMLPALAAGLAATALAIVALTASPSAAQRIGTVAAFATAGVALSIVSGSTGRLSLGHWALAACGAAVAEATSGVVGVPVGLALAALAGGAAGLLAGLPSLRSGALGYAASSLALAVAVPGGLVAAGLLRPDGLVGGSAGRSGPALLAVACLVASLAVAWTVRHGRLGRAMVAVRDDPRAAAAHGVARWRTLLTADLLSGAIAGIAGYAYLLNQRLPHPESFAADRSVWLLAAAVVGGLGSLGGAVAGVAVVAATTLFLPSGWGWLGTGTGLLLVILVRPSGLVSLLEVVRDGAQRKTLLRRVRLAHEPVRAPDRVPPGDGRVAWTRPDVRAFALAAVAMGTIAWSGAIETYRLASLGADRSLAVWASALVVAIAVAVAGASRFAGGRGMTAAGAAAVALTGWGAITGTDVEMAVAVAAAPAAWTIGAIVAQAGHVPPSIRSAAAGATAVAAVAGLLPAAALQIADPSRVPAPWYLAVAVLGTVAALVAVRRRPAGSRETTLPPAASGALPALAVSDLVVGYDNAPVLRGVDLQVSRGEVVAIVGPNGSGKSTLLHAAAGLLRPLSGGILAAGFDTAWWTPDELFGAGVVFVDGSDPVFAHMTVEENLRVAAWHTHRRSGSAAAAAAELLDALPHLGARRDLHAGALSGGEQRLLALAQSLFSRPALLLVDELGIGLSAQSASDLRAFLRIAADDGAGVVFVDHDADGAAFADRVVVLSDGSVAYDGPPDGLPSAPAGADRATLLREP